MAAAIVGGLAGFGLARAFRGRSGQHGQAALSDGARASLCRMLVRIRELMGGPASAALVMLMLVGCLFLWIGVPIGWLWIGSQVQGSASLGTALMVTMVGIVVTIIGARVRPRLAQPPPRASCNERRHRPTAARRRSR